MKSTILLALATSALVLATSAFAAEFPFERIHGTGPTTNRVHVMIVSDGWTQADLDTGRYKTLAKGVSDYLVQRQPFKDYAHLINVTRVDVPSVESGVSHAWNNSNKNTYYGSQYPSEQDPTGNPTDSRGLWFKDPAVAQTKIKETNPALTRHVTVVLCNDGTYGGAANYSRGMCTVSTDTRANEVFFHELGHALMNLADEYAYAPFRALPADEPVEANVSKESDPAKVKWKKWFATGTNPTAHACRQGTPCPQPGMGIHEEAKYTQVGMYRPREKCLMRALNNPMCEPCSERSVKRFYENVTLVDKRTPASYQLKLIANSANTGAAQSFSVDAVGGPNSKIEATWYVDGSEQKGAENKTATGMKFTFNAPAEKLPVGSHLVRVLLRDKTPMLRDPEPGAPVTGLFSFIYYFAPNNAQWNVKVEASGIIPTLRRMIGW